MLCLGGIDVEGGAGGNRGGALCPWGQKVSCLSGISPHAYTETQAVALFAAELPRSLEQRAAA